jgi:hypothetical protein
MATTELTDIVPLYGTHGSYGEIFLAKQKILGQV